MSKFLKVTISVKPNGLQAYPNKEILLSTDAILLASASGQNSYSISLKPEYDAAVKKALGLDIRNEFSAITTTSKDINDLLEVVKS
jgi:hypothetical protein